MSQNISRTKLTSARNNQRREIKNIASDKAKKKNIFRDTLDYAEQKPAKQTQLTMRVMFENRPALLFL